MKTSIKMLIALMAVSVQFTSVYAQNAGNGIYMNEQDYKSGKLSYVLGQADKLHLNDFLSGKNISLTSGGKKVKLSKSQIFGYRLNNQDFRFYKNAAYRVIDSAGFMLYSHQQLTAKGKGYAPVENYFYSTGAASPILSLTIANVAESFPEQIDFKYSVKSYFHTDADLPAFDKASKQYEIKHLYFEYKRTAGQQHASL